MAASDDQTALRKDALRYLRALGEKAFAEVFYEAVQDRPKDEVFAEHFVLAIVANMEGIESGLEDWRLRVVGLPADGRSWPDNAAICQEGQCPHCTLAVASWAKQIRCPICGAEAYGT